MSEDKSKLEGKPFWKLTDAQVLDAAMQCEVTGRVTTDSLPNSLSGRDVEIEGAHHVEGIEHGRIETTLRSVQNVPRQRREGASKSGRMARILMNNLKLDHAYGTDHLKGLMPADLDYQDLMNAVAKLKREGKLVRSGALWIVVKQAA